MRFECTIGGARISGGGDVRMSVVVPLTEISGAVSTLRLIDKSFDLGIVSDAGKFIVKAALFGGLKIDREGQSNVSFLLDPASMGNLNFATLAAMKSKTITVAIKEKRGSTHGQDDEDEGGS